MADLTYPIPKLKTLLWRGCRKVCPQCGLGPLFKRWLKLHDKCAVCGLQYLPNQGDLWGPIVLLDRLLFLIPFIVLIYFRLWTPNGIGFYLVAAAMIFLLVFTMPHRLGISLAIDYLIRRKSGDLSGDGSTDQT
jgi:uncharacterized protein (DUF983 family)